MNLCESFALDLKISDSFFFFFQLIILAFEVFQQNIVFLVEAFNLTK
jgi:hypothetical protein